MRPRDADVVVVAVPSKAFAAVVAALPGDGARAEPHEGPRPGNRRAPVDARPEPPRRRALRPEHGGGDRGRAADRGGDRERDDGYLAGQLQHAINSTVFRVYVNPDVVGVELCAAAKNVIALAAGAVDGLDLGDNAKASLVTRGLAEMARLGEAAGARPETFSGLAGMGDLIVTCWSRHGRNRRAGELIAQGASPEEAAAEIGQIVEGLTTAPVLRDALAPTRRRAADNRGRLRGTLRAGPHRSGLQSDGAAADRGVTCPA